MEKDKIKRFIEVHIPVTACNLRCHYCYITQLGLWKNKKTEFNYSIDTIRKSLSVKRLGGKCMMNLCGGGETLIPDETLQIARAFLEEGHYVTIVTNGTISKRFDELANFPAHLLERLFFKFSFQYLELVRTGMMQKFFENINKVKQLGCSIAVEITPNDELIPYIDEIKNISLKNLKALPHITIARVDSEPGVPMLTTLSKKEFKKVWGQFKSKMLEFKLPVFGQKRKEFCYAGDWSFFVNVGTGVATKCYKGESLGNIFENPDAPINFSAIGCNCPLSHCYNAHSFLLWGDIPYFTKVTYADIRNRICSDGTQWLNPKMKSFMSTKLNESNKEYSYFEKKTVDKNKLNCKCKKNPLKNLFSITNHYNQNVKTHKIITVLGLKIKLRLKNKIKPNLQNNSILQLKAEIDNLKLEIKNTKYYLEMERFDRQLRDMAPKDQFIFVCINGLGDTMMYASYWRELENKFNDKIFWVVEKSHEIVLKMYGITNYMTFDYISFKKRGHFSNFVNITPMPRKGVPFYAHWTYNLSTVIGADYFLDFVRNTINLQNVPFNNPLWYPSVCDNLRNKIRDIKDLNNTILISPEARYLTIDDCNFWNKLTDSLINAGFEVIVNDALNKINIKSGVKCGKLNCEELVAVAMNCHAVISPRSGFTDIIHQLGERLFVFYNKPNYLDLFTLNKLCTTKDVNEFVYAQDFDMNIIVSKISELNKRSEKEVISV